MEIVSDIKIANCITHSGTMHADDVFSTAFLDLYLGNVKVFRTTNVDFDKVNEDTLIYDIGRGEFDHHQPTAEKRENGITYCSFGLLWKKFGRDFLKSRNIKCVEEVFNGIDKDLVEAIDADDNGFFPKIEADYKVKTTSNIIKLFNPSFDSEQDENVQFLKAVAFAKVILEEEILYINGKVFAEQKLKEVIEKLDKNSKYIILDEFLPYEETILNCSDLENVLYVVFPSNRGGYAIKTLPNSIEDKTARLLFPEEWAGLDGVTLEKVSNIKGLNFCHLGRFIACCDNLETVCKVLNFLCK